MRKISLKNILMISSIFFTLFTFSFSVFLKIFRLENLQYTSDMFTYHQMAVETLKGNFGFDFTYGWHFGEHFFGWHLLYTPIVWLTGEYSIFVYLLSGPIFFLIASLFAYMYFKSKSEDQVFPWIALLLFSTQYSVLQYLQEPVYGFHFDLLAGFLFIILIFVLDREEYNFFAPVFLILYLALVMIKQEFTAIAVILWFVMYIFGRDRVFLIHFLLALLLFLFQMWVIELSASAFNRTPEGLIIRSYGQVFLNVEKLVFTTIVDNFIWLALNGAALILAYFIIPKKHFALIFIIYVAGGVKIFTATMIAGDPYIHTWHSAPAIPIITFAFLIVCANVSKVWRNSLLLAMFATSFWMYATYLPPNLQNTSVSQKKAAIEQFKSQIPEEEVVAIHPYFARLFLDRRYTFFPRGISMSPQGISDAIIILESEYKKWENQLADEFKVEATQSGIYLLRRVKINDENSIIRSSFFELLWDH